MGTGAGGAPNPLIEHVSRDPAILAFVSVDEVRAAMDVGHYVGDAPERERRIAEQIDAVLI